MGMKEVRVNNLSRPLDEPLQVRWCRSFFCRLRGLMFRKRIKFNEGLVLVQQRAGVMNTAVHMLFVFTDLAVIWLNGAGQVVDVVVAKSWHPHYAPKQPARYILECAPERAAEFQIGDQISFEEL